MSNLTQKNTFIPAKAIHPGGILKDELLARDISQKDLAKLTGLQPTHLNEIIKGKRDISPDIALSLSKALQMEVTIWTNLQTLYHLQKAQLAEKTNKRLMALDLWNMLKQYIPVTYFRKLGIISGDPVTDIPVIYKIYSIPNIDELVGLFSKPQFARFRKSDKLQEEKINLLGWQYLAMYKASELNVPEFKPADEKKLIGELKTAISENADTISNVTKILKQAGIKLLLLEKPEKCPVDGVSFMSGTNPAIALTMRYKRLDNFAFTLMHELGHVFMHLKNNPEAVFIDFDSKEANIDYKNSKEEQQADEYANSKWMNQDDWNLFITSKGFKKLTAIIEFSQKQNINPAIVLGKVKHHTGNYALHGKIPDVN